MASADFSLIRRILRLAERLEKVSDDDLQERGLSLKYQATTGTKIDELIPDAFALVYEAVRRTTDKRLYNVQLFAGIQLARCYVAE